MWVRTNQEKYGVFALDHSLHFHQRTSVQTTKTIKLISTRYNIADPVKSYNGQQITWAVISAVCYKYALDAFSILINSNSIDWWKWHKNKKAHKTWSQTLTLNAAKLQSNIIIMCWKINTEMPTLFTGSKSTRALQLYSI